LWLLGYPDQALAKSQESIALAEKRDHPYSLAYALNFAAILYQLRREPSEVQIRAEDVVSLSVKHKFPTWQATGLVLHGWALMARGKPAEGIIRIQEGLTIWRDLGAEISLAYLLSLLAEAHGRERDFQRAISVINEALSLVSRTDDHWWEAELYRLKGELLLQVEEFKEGIPMQKRERLIKGKEQKADSLSSLLLAPGVQIKKEAEMCFQRALSVARQQQAKSLELRAAISLARLWRRQNKAKEAKSLLSEVYNWFAEGFETTDLCEAQSLLSKLRQATTASSPGGSPH
jgi:predicted ATPase